MSTYSSKPYISSQAQIYPDKVTRQGLHTPNNLSNAGEPWHRICICPVSANRKTWQPKRPRPARTVMPPNRYPPRHLRNRRFPVTSRFHARRTQAVRSMALHRMAQSVYRQAAVRFSGILTESGVIIHNTIEERYGTCSRLRTRRHENPYRSRCRRVGWTCFSRCGVSLLARCPVG